MFIETGLRALYIQGVYLCKAKNVGLKTEKNKLQSLTAWAKIKEHVQILVEISEHKQKNTTVFKYHKIRNKN